MGIHVFHKYTHTLYLHYIYSYYVHYFTGHGSFGTVVKAKLRQQINEIVTDEVTQEPKLIKVVTDVDVAVKVLTRSQGAKMSGTSDTYINYKFISGTTNVCFCSYLYIATYKFI